MFSIISMSGNKVSTKEEKEKYVTRIERERVAPDLNHRRGEERKAFRSCSVRLSRTPTLAETCTFHQHLHSTVMAHPAAGRTPDLVLLSHTGAEDRGSLLTQVQARQSWKRSQGSGTRCWLEGSFVNLDRAECHPWYFPTHSAPP